MWEGGGCLLIVGQDASDHLRKLCQGDAVGRSIVYGWWCCLDGGCLTFLMWENIPLYFSAGVE